MGTERRIKTIERAVAMFALACTSIVSLALPLFAHAQGANSSKQASVCQTIADALPPRGAMLPPGSILNIIAARPHSLLRLRPPQGFSLESTYIGSAHCQRNALYQTIAGGKKRMPIPGRFEGGEGALCADDRVHLGTVAGALALLEEAPNDDQADLDIAVMKRGGWVPSCRLTVSTTADYGIKERFCRGDDCDTLAILARKMADARHSSSDHADDNPKLTSQQTNVWRQMEYLAGSREFTMSPLPTLGEVDPHTSGGAQAIYEHSYAEVVFSPLVVRDRVLWGKVGLAGVSLSHAGSAKLFSAYELVGDHLEPVAGFYLDAIGKTLADIRTSVSP